MRTFWMVAPVVVGLGAVSVASAAVMPPDLDGFKIEIQFVGGSWSSVNDPGSITDITPNPDKAGQYAIGGSKTNGSFDISWDLNVDIDPFISSSFNVTNVTGVPQQFVITVTLPIIPQLPSTSALGSISGSLLDSNFSGASSVATNGSAALYEALIDGVNIEELYSDPYTLASANLTENLPTANFGPQAEIGANATIGIRNTFILSPGDTFQAVSALFINAVPGPGAVAVFGLAGVAATRRRR